MNSQSFELMKGRPMIHLPTPTTDPPLRRLPLLLSSLSSSDFPLLRTELGSILTGLYLSESQCPLLVETRDTVNTSEPACHSWL